MYGAVLDFPVIERNTKAFRGIHESSQRLSRVRKAVRVVPSRMR